jgi:hypothetical protein
MGYDLHITRKQDWSEDEPKISMTEWVAYLESDPSMRLDGYAETTTAEGVVLRAEDEGLAVWTEWSGGEEWNMAWFRFWRGDIVVKNPDEEILRKMWLVAQALGARVQGDDGEIYGQDGSIVEE